VLDVLVRLVDKSLVQAETQAGAARYRLLETVRQYASEKLLAASEERAVRERHAAWCVALAERTEPALRGADQLAALALLTPEQDNLRAALDWLLAAEPRQALHLAASLGQFWRFRGASAEGRRWLATALDAAGQPPPGAAGPWMRAQREAGFLARQHGDLTGALVAFTASLALAREVGDQRYIASALKELSPTHLQLGDLGQARATAEESVAQARAIGDPRLLIEPLAALGEVMARGEGDYRGARTLLTDTLAWHRATGHQWNVTISLFRLSRVERTLGDVERAQAMLDEALDLAQSLGAPRLLGITHAALGDTARWCGDAALAATQFETGLAASREVDDEAQVARNLIGLGRTMVDRGDLTRATALLLEGLALAQHIQTRPEAAVALYVLGHAAWRQGDVGSASALLKESLTLRRAIGERLGIVECLEGLAMVAAGTSQPTLAARLLGAADAGRQAMGTPLPPADRRWYETTIASARGALGEAGFAAAWAVGQHLTLDEAAAEEVTSEQERAGCGDTQPGNSQEPVPWPMGRC
jgi:tetratricopeptide (TPR) repeat protein